MDGQTGPKGNVVSLPALVWGCEFVLQIPPLWIQFTNYFFRLPSFQAWWVLQPSDNKHLLINYVVAKQPHFFALFFF